MFRVGSLFPMFRALDEQLDRGGVQRFHGFLMAVREINDKSDGVLDDVLPGVTIRHAARDSKRDTGFAFFGALYLADRAFDDTGVHAYVGAASSGPSINAARISTEFGVPQVSYSSTSVELSDSEQFPLFMRLPPSDEFQGKAMAELVQHLGWREVVTISSSGGYGLAGIQEFQKAAELGTEIVLRETFTLKREDGGIELVLSVPNRSYLFYPAAVDDAFDAAPPPPRRPAAVRRLLTRREAANRPSTAAETSLWPSSRGRRPHPSRRLASSRTARRPGRVAPSSQPL